MPHVRICGGGYEQSSSLLRLTLGVPLGPRHRAARLPGRHVVPESRALGPEHLALRRPVNDGGDPLAGGLVEKVLRKWGVVAVACGATGAAGILGHRGDGPGSADAGARRTVRRSWAGQRSTFVTVGSPGFLSLTVTIFPFKYPLGVAATSHSVPPTVMRSPARSSCGKTRSPSESLGMPATRTRKDTSHSWVLPPATA
jgi:hypothetical protein